MITLAPDDSEKTFQVSHALLIAASSWFEKALDMRFKEGHDRVLRLLDTDTATIENFLFWLYHRRNPFSKSETLNTEECDDDEARRVAAIRFWAFGDKHFIPRMQEIAMLTLVRSMEQPRRWPSPNIIKLGYTVSAAGSPLRRLLSEASIAGLIAHQLPAAKKGRRRHERHERHPELAPPLTVGPEGYTLADFEPIEDTPGLLIDVLKAFVQPLGADAATALRDIINRYLQRIPASTEGDNDPDRQITG